MLNEIISSYSKKSYSVSDIKNDEVIAVYLNKSTTFKSGETLPLFSAYGIQDTNSSFGYDLKYAEKFNANVFDVIYIDENDLLLYNILSHYSSGLIILFPEKTVRNLKLPYQNYDNIYLRYNENVSNKEVKSLIESVYTPISHMSFKTITDCQNNLNRSMLKEYIIAFNVFGLMIILSLIGYFQTLKLQVSRKSESIRNLRILGMNVNKLCLLMYAEFVKIPVLSGLLSVLSVYGVREFLKYQYDKCTKLYDMAMEITDTSSEEFIEIYSKFAENQERFMTAYEMYKVPDWRFLAVLFAIIFVCISVYILIISKRHALSDLGKSEE